MSSSDDRLTDDELNDPGALLAWWFRRLAPFIQHRDHCKVNEYENERLGERRFPCTCGMHAALGKTP